LLPNCRNGKIYGSQRGECNFINIALQHTPKIVPAVPNIIKIMAPSAIDVDVPIHSKQESKKPLKYSGSLDSYESFDPTPAIGTEYPTANLVDWLNAPNADELIKDLAIKSLLPLLDEICNRC
jgi:hypothetical protein